MQIAYVHSWQKGWIVSERSLVRVACSIVLATIVNGTRSLGCTNSSAQNVYRLRDVPVTACNVSAMSPASRLFRSENHPNKVKITTKTNVQRCSLHSDKPITFYPMADQATPSHLAPMLLLHTKQNGQDIYPLGYIMCQKTLLRIIFGCFEYWSEMEHLV